jgi:hypothetical protein
MESTGRFEKYFLKSLRENNTSGAGGAFGDGPSTADLYVPAEQGSGIKKSNTPGDSRIARPLGTGKVQTRKKAVGGKKRRNKKEKGVSYLTGEENAEDVHKPVKPGILKKRLGELSCSKVRTAKGKLKDKGTHYAKALQRYLNYHC